ncbi:MAG: hypothetical protein DME24_00920 [Verrucomicrobia bacterium]|nr:MAG: hypothetical protein DME24_00920 [Verrucomicrobiota bacterium]
MRSAAFTPLQRAKRKQAGHFRRPLHEPRLHRDNCLLQVQHRIVLASSWFRCAIVRSWKLSMNRTRKSLEMKQNNRDRFMASIHVRILEVSPPHEPAIGARTAMSARIKSEALADKAVRAPVRRWFHGPDA